MKFACFLALSKVLLSPGWGVDGGSEVLGVGWEWYAWRGRFSYKSDGSSNFGK